MNKVPLIKSTSRNNFFPVLFAIAMAFGLTLSLGLFFQAVYGQQDSDVSLPTTNNVNTSSSGLSPETLGNPVYIENTQSTSIRVLDVNLIPSVEVSYMGNSTIGGIETQTIGTTVNKMGNNGSVHTQGQAIIMASNGQTMTYTTQSRGYYGPDGSFSDSGIMVFNLPFSSSPSQSPGTSSSSIEQPRGLSSFDDMVGIYKKTVDRFGNGLTTVWEWK